MAEVLILEPDEKLGAGMKDVLTRAGYSCERATTIADGLAHTENAERVLTILNARLPWSDSFHLLKALAA